MRWCARSVKNTLNALLEANGKRSAALRRWFTTSQLVCVLNPTVCTSIEEVVVRHSAFDRSCTAVYIRARTPGVNVMRSFLLRGAVSAICRGASDYK
jgi:hypothetical protein